MKELNFIAGGMMGDFIHSLFVVYNLCKKEKAFANIYLTDSGDTWRYGLDKAYLDLKELMLRQPYIKRFEVCMDTSLIENPINLNTWRQVVAETHNRTGKYDICWTDLLSQHYGFEYPPIEDFGHKWLGCVPDDRSKGRYLVHRSKHRHNAAFPMQELKDSFIDPLFVTTDINEHILFEKECGKIELLLVKDIWELASTIAGCAFFFGNQSAPLALACALDVPRNAELDHDPAPFYIGEERYSKNMNWWLSSTQFKADQAWKR